jgi:hypothetical protein
MKLEKHVINYLKFMSDLFILIYSDGGASATFMKHFKGGGGQAIKVWKTLA